MSKARKLEMILTRDEEKNIKEVKATTLANTIGSEYGIKRNQSQDLLTLHLKDQALELDDDLDPADKKCLTKAYNAIGKAIELHDKLLAEQEKAKAAEEAELAKAKAVEDKKTSAIMIAGAKAQGVSQALTDNAITNMQKVLGKNFVVTDTGLTIADGALITEEGMAQAIATLATSSEGLDDIRAITMWNLGDLCIELESLYPERAEEILLAAVDAKGKQKHTVQCAIATCRKTPHDRRFPELTFTHHQEIANYADKIKSKKTLDKIIADARVADVKKVTTPDGREITHTKPQSCAVLRKALQEAAGIVPELKAPKEPVKVPTEAPESQDETPTPAASRGFIYIEGATGDAFASKVLSDKALKSGAFSILDLDAMRVLNADGSEGDQIMQLPEEFLDETPEAPKKEKKSKVKKEKVAPEPTPEPESDGGDDIPG